MAVIIGSARIDENGKAHGGKAGDQTGKEVSTQNWYKHSKGWRAFRFKDPEKAEKAAKAMQAACDNPNVGYDQYQRTSLYTAVKYVGFDPAKAASPVETDCSALVRVCCAYAGVTLPNFYTGDQPKTLLDSGAFVELTGKKYTDSSDYLKRGDILVTKTSGHTVIVLTDGPKAADDKPVADEPDTNYRVKILTGNWYVRTSSNKNAPSLGIAKAGESYPYLNVTENGWDKIFFNGEEGYVSSKGSELELNQKYIEIKGTWYVRTAPGKEASSIGTVHTGDKIPYRGVNEYGWYGVVFKETNAWISEKSGKIV